MDSAINEVVDQAAKRFLVDFIVRGERRANWRYYAS
jgi:hypothetical protein